MHFKMRFLLQLHFCTRPATAGLFKKITKIIFSVFLLFGTISCGEYLNGPKKKEQTLSVELKEAECLKDLPLFISNYFGDKSSATEIKANFGCLQNSLNKFKRYTKGESEQQYTYSELLHFFNRYLLDGQKISEEMMLEFMKVKVWAIGGSHRAITRLEFEQLNDYLEILAVEAERLNGFWKILLFAEKAENFQQDHFEKAMKALRPALTNLIFESKSSSAQYELGDLGLLFQNLSEFLGDRGELRKLMRWFPTIIATKQVFLGEFLKITSRSEWKSVIDWSLEGYQVALMYFYQVRSASFERPENLDLLVNFGDRILRLLETSKVMEERGRLSLAGLDELATRLELTGILPKFLSAELLQSTYKKVFFHWLEGRRENVSHLQAIELKHVSALRFEYEVWRQNQVSLNRLFTTSPAEIKPKAFAKLQREPNPSLQLPLLRFQYDQAWAQWNNILSSGVNPRLRADFRIVLPESQAARETMSYNFPGLTMSNLMSTVTRLCMRGYGIVPNGDFAKASMSEKDLIAMEIDFRDIGQAIGLLDRRIAEPAQRTFKEASYFTFSGDGDDRLDALETYEILHFMVSGGFSVTNDFYRRAIGAGCGLATLDIQGDPRLNLSCVKQTFFKEVRDLLSHIPKMAKALAELSQDEKDRVFGELYLVSKMPVPVDGETERSELRTFFSIIQYVESLLVQYDKDSNQKLSKGELEKAEPRFHSFIASVSPIKQNTFVREVFLYILIKGEVPPKNWGQMNSGLLRYTFQRAFGNLQEVDRFDLIKVLGVLKSNGKTN